MAIIANKRDYKRGYQKHYSTYHKIQHDMASVYSRRLILVYSVECGLKYLLMDRWRLDSPARLADGGEQKNVLFSHDLEKILKELGQEGAFHFPQMTTSHKDRVTARRYHEVYRYCINIDDSRRKEEEFEQVLLKAAEWIGRWI